MKYYFFKTIIGFLFVFTICTSVFAGSFLDSVSIETFNKVSESFSNSISFQNVSKSEGNKNLKNPFNGLEFKLGFTIPFSMEKDFGFKKSFEQNLEILVPFQVSKSLVMNTGIEMKYGKINLSHTINKLVWVESSGGMYPFQITNQFFSKYFRFGIPVNFETLPEKSSFPVSFVFGAGLGYQIFLDAENKYELSENNPANTFYANSKLGIKIRLLKIKRHSFNLLPGFGYHFFLNHQDNWHKKNYPFFNLSLSLKKLTN